MSFADIDFTVDLKESETEVSRPKRCQAPGCRQKIKLTDSACKCKSFFCGVHRHGNGLRRVEALALGHRLLADAKTSKNPPEQIV